LSALGALVARDLRLAVRHGGDSMVVLIFFLLTVMLFPFGVGPAPEMLARIAPGIIWVAALLAAMLSLDLLFRSDYEDGTLEQLALAPVPLPAVVAAKALAHWLVTGLPIVLLSPALALALQLETQAISILFAALLLGTPALTLIGAIGAALTLGARSGGVLIALLILPLFVPVLIFGAGAVDAAAHDLPAQAHLMILGALSLFALVLGPLAAAAGLRQALE